MARSYVLSFPDERRAFEAFMQDTPANAVMLVDTFDTLTGVRHAIEAARATGVLKGVRLDSGDLLALSRAARALLDDAGMPDARIVASGDLDERGIAALVAAGAPIDVWGVGTALGTSHDSPTVGGVYKLVADQPPGQPWRPVAKRSPDKATLPGPKQVYRCSRNGTMTEDILATTAEQLDGQPLLAAGMRDGRLVVDEPVSALRARAAAQLDALPLALRRLDATPTTAHPVRLSPALRQLAAATQSNTSSPVPQHGVT